MNGLSIVTGIGISFTASILAVIFITISNIVWKHILLNLWLKLSCRHISDISGEWEANYTTEHGTQTQKDIIIQQFGWKIIGQISYSAKYPDQKHMAKIFKFEGVFRNDILAVHHWNKSNKEKGLGSYTLSLKNGGDILRGSISWYDPDNEAIRSDSQKWIRKSKESIGKVEG